MWIAKYQTDYSARPLSRLRILETCCRTSKECRLSRLGKLAHDDRPRPWVSWRQCVPTTNAIWLCLRNWTMVSLIPVMQPVVQKLLGREFSTSWWRHHYPYRLLWPSWSIDNRKEEILCDVHNCEVRMLQDSAAVYARADWQNLGWFIRLSATSLRDFCEANPFRECRRVSGIGAQDEVNRN